MSVRLLEIGDHRQWMTLTFEVCSLDCSTVIVSKKNERNMKLKKMKDFRLCCCTFLYIPKVRVTKSIRNVLDIRIVHDYQYAYIFS